jgi:hypothetical protein
MDMIFQNVFKFLSDSFIVCKLFGVRKYGRKINGRYEA